MATSNQGIKDLGNGLGYIYITSPIATPGSPLIGEVVKVLDNTDEGLKTAKIYGLQGASLASNRVASAELVMGTPTGVGTITDIRISAVSLIDTAKPIPYTGATTASVLAQLVVSAINSYSTGTESQDFTAVQIGASVHIYSNAASGSTYNGNTTGVTSTGFLTVTNGTMEGGSSNSELFDTGYGYQFFLDADYDASGCSGGGTATVDDISKAIEVTNYLVFIGLQSAIPSKPITLASDSITYDREGSFMLLVLTGEGSADDDLKNIVAKNPSVGDRIVLYSLTNTITVDETGNINLQTTTLDVLTSSVMELIYNSDGNWYELSRSTQVIGSTTDYRTAGFGIFSSETYNTATVATGGTINFEPNVHAKYQKITGSSTLASNLNYSTAGSPENGDEFWMEIDATVTTGAFTMTVFGTTLTSDQALNGGLIVYTRYVSGAWYSQVLPNLNDGLTNTFKFGTDSIVANSIKVDSIETSLQTELVVVPVSFESSAEVGLMKITIPYNCNVVSIKAAVTKLIEATDDATIIPKNHSGTAMTAGQIDLTAASPIGNIFPSSPTGNNSFTAGQVMSLETSKTTYGGKALVSIELLRTT